MLRTIPRVLVAVGVVAVAATTAGCGGETVDKPQACANIQQEFQSLVQAGTQQREDPQALAETLRSSATKIRDQGAAVEGDDVEQATHDAATALEQLADRLAAGEPQQADLNTLVESGTKIRAACGP